MLNDDRISWKSRRQPSVDLSTSEPEYMTPSEVRKEILYLRPILRDVTSGEGNNEEDQQDLQRPSLDVVTLCSKTNNHNFSFHNHNFREFKVQRLLSFIFG
jgi:hypothetical protein